MQLLQFSSLAKVPHLRHALTTRDGGVSKGEFSTLNLAFHVNDDPAKVEENRQLLARELDYDPASLISAQQVHSDTVHIVRRETLSETTIPANDALVTQEMGIPLLIMVADCAPILLVDPENHVLAVVHAGWRGALAKIASKTVQTMRENFGTSNVLAGIGPCLSVENLEIGLEVAGEISAVDPAVIIGGWVKPHLDLRGLIERDLQSAGVSAQNIETMPFCPFDDERFFSHRGQKGTAGRFGIVAWWEQ